MERRTATAGMTALAGFWMVLFLLQNLLEQWFTPFQYSDEIFALLVIPLLALRLLQKRLHIVWDRKKVLFLIFLAVFWVRGWCGYFAWHYQPLWNTALDAYVNIKFFLAVGAAFLMFGGTDIDYAWMRQRLWWIALGMTAVLFALCIADQCLGIFEADLRGGLRSIKLFYSAYTVLAGNCLFLCAVYLWMYAKKRSRKILVPLVMTIYVMLCTRRVKALGAAVCVVLVWILILHRRKKMSRRLKILIVAVTAAAAAAGIYQIVDYYFLMGVESARAVLTIAAPFLAMDHFPFGTGWGTYGSAFSAEPYSPVYGMYWMAGVWGLSPDYPEFVSDTFWPMVMGQCGFFGFAAFIAALVLFVKRVFTMKRNRRLFGSAVLILLYLFISSTSESAFANPVSVPLAFWLGLLFAENKSSGIWKSEAVL